MSAEAEIQPTTHSSAAMNTFKSLCSGALAGAVSRTATSPLERLKVMKQVQAEGNAYGGIIKALGKMWREEGPLSFWRGNGTNVVRIAPYSAIQFFSFDKYKRFLTKEGTSANGPNGIGNVRLLTAGAMSGMTSSIICYPLDLVRSVLTVQTDRSNKFGIMQTIGSIYRDGGVVALYRGLVPTMFGIAPYVAINFAVFDNLKRRYVPKDRSDPTFDVLNLLCGAGAGGTAAAITYPTDVLRRRMQLSGFDSGAAHLPKYNSTWHCITTTFKTEGMIGFYKGLTPCLLKVVPSMAIAFAIYERCRKLLKFDPVEKGVSSGG